MARAEFEVEVAAVGCEAAMFPTGVSRAVNDLAGAEQISGGGSFAALAVARRSPRRGKPEPPVAVSQPPSVALVIIRKPFGGEQAERALMTFGGRQLVCHRPALTPSVKTTGRRRACCLAVARHMAHVQAVAGREGGAGSGRAGGKR